MNNNSTDHRVHDVSLGVDLHGDEIAHHIATFTTSEGGQAQISDPGHTWKLHITGTSDAWRHLARLIDDAAMELDALEQEQATRDRALTHYTGLADQVRTAEPVGGGF